MPPNRNALAAVAAATIAGFSGSFTPASEAARTGHAGHLGSCADARRGLAFYHRSTNRWRDRLDRQPLTRPPLVAAGCWSIRVQAHAWRGRSRLHRQQYRNWYRWAYAKWRCIHEHEGPWDDPNGPYYGGLQMDLSFQRAHGWDFYRRWGTADNWPVWAQLVTAERAYRTRGFQPWPTARYCR